eukprot:363288-Chlamydomonas_euryale.AAC.9
MPASASTTAPAAAAADRRLGSSRVRASCPALPEPQHLPDPHTQPNPTSSATGFWLSTPPLISWPLPRGSRAAQREGRCMHGRCRALFGGRSHPSSPASDIPRDAVPAHFGLPVMHANCPKNSSKEACMLSTQGSHTHMPANADLSTMRMDGPCARAAVLACAQAWNVWHALEHLQSVCVCVWAQRRSVDGEKGRSLLSRRECDKGA